MPSEWQMHKAPSVSWHSPTALENLYLNPDVPKPTGLKAGAVLVRMRAAALNARDMMVMAHDPIYPGVHIEGLVPCADGAGEIEEVGEDSVWKVGERVMVHLNSWIDQIEPPAMDEVKSMGAAGIQGTLREYAVFNDSQLIKAPNGLTFEEIAAMPAAYGTSMNAVFFGPVPLKAGMTVLTQGTGGCSIAAIQLAVAAGATVISTTSSSTKASLLLSLGATHVINYTTHPSWSSEVLRLTNNRGVDHVIEMGGSSTLEQSLLSTRLGGLISMVGFLSEPKQSDLVLQIIFGAKTLRGVYNVSKPMSQSLVNFVAEKKIHPVIAKTFEWEDAKEAFRYLMNLDGGMGMGKIVIKI